MISLNREIFEGKEKEPKSSQITGFSGRSALMDLLETKKIDEQLKNAQIEKSLDTNTFWATFGPETMLSKVSEDVNKLKALLNCPSIVDDLNNQKDLALRLPLVLLLRD